MKAFLDTSVLVAVFYGDHVHHQRSFDLYRRFNIKTGACGAHSLAEIYATMTRMPPPHRLSGDQVMLFLAEIRAKLSLIALEGEDYFAALGAFAAQGVVGGAIYDGLLARCAMKSRAETIYTWNIKHYRRLGPEIERRLSTP